MSIPQLRVRSGYSFRKAYGRHPEIIERLKEIEAPAAGLVDTGTWTHVRFEKAMTAAGMNPMYGMEIPVIGHDDEHLPRAWILAEDTRRFYNITTETTQQGGADFGEWDAMCGVIRFSGGAVEILPPEVYDYIDINPSSYVLANSALKIARRTGKALVLTSYNDMPHPRYSAYAYAWEVGDAVGMRHIADEAEIWDTLRHCMTESEFRAAVLNTYAIAERLKDVRLAKAPMIHLDGDLVARAREGQASRLARGHIAAWTTEYEERLLMELDLIRQKDFDAYFLVVSDLIAYAKQHMLVGPARGSSAGSLVCYLLDITEVDPLPHGLLFQRFIDETRQDLPDIDIDFSDTKRHLVFEYLQKKYGRANVVHLGNINTLKAASVMAQVGKKFDIPFGETVNIKNALIEYSSGDARYGKGLQDTLDNTDPGRRFKERHPNAADCMGDLEIHPSHSSVHAAGILVCNDAISDYCTVNAEGVAHIDKPDIEHLNLLKIDALGLRTLGIIEDTGVVTAEQLYSLKLDDVNAFSILNEDKVGGIFQFEGDIVRSVAKFIHIDCFAKIDNITALARPGPLASGMEHKYIARAAGKEQVSYDVPELEKYLKETYGVILYQEQIMSMVKEIGLFDWKKTAAVRKAMSGSKGEEYFNTMGEDFVKGATSQGIPHDKAVKMWKEMVTFGSWCFNKSHSVSYGIVTYWTCWLKYYHRLEYAAACLRAAKDDDQTIAILRELKKEGVDYTPIDPDYSEANWTVAEGRLVGGILNAKGYGPVKALDYVQKRAAGKLTEKDRDKLIAAGAKFTDLYEAHTKWGHYYRYPEDAGVVSGNPIVDIKTVKDRDDCLVIVRLVRKILADENEAIRIKKRGGKRYEGEETAFLDMMVVDDSLDAAMRFRIRPDKYQKLGKPIAEDHPVGSWYLVKAWKIADYIMIVKNIKLLTDEDLAAAMQKRFGREEEPEIAATA